MEEALLSIRAFDPSTVIPKGTEFVKHASVEGRAAKAARTEGGSDELPTTLCLEAFSETVGAQISGNRVGQLKVLYDEFQRNFAWSSNSWPFHGVETCGRCCWVKQLMFRLKCIVFCIHANQAYSSDFIRILTANKEQKSGVEGMTDASLGSHSNLTHVSPFRSL